MRYVSGLGLRRRSSGSRFGNAGLEDIFKTFQHMGNGVHTEYIYAGGGSGNRYTHMKEQTDIKATLVISETIARNGGEVLFNHNGRNITLKIKPDTHPGQRLRIRGQGRICPYCGHSGDIIVTIK